MCTSIFPASNSTHRGDLSLGLSHSQRRDNSAKQPTAHIYTGCSESRPHLNIYLSSHLDMTITAWIGFFPVHVCRRFGVVIVIWVGPVRVFYFWSFYIPRARFCTLTTSTHLQASQPATGMCINATRPFANLSRFIWGTVMQSMCLGGLEE